MRSWLFQGSSVSQQWKGSLTATSRKMIILLKQQCQKHLKLLRSEFNQTLDQLRSQCSTLTFRQIKHFLKESACELSRELHSRHRKKLSASTGVCVPLAFIRTRHNNSNHRNRSNLPQIPVNSSHSPVTTSTNHVNDQSINHITTTVNHPTPTRNPTVSSHPVINAPDHSTPIRSRIRRRKRKTKTNRYWRRDNHNIQLDTNAVINLSSVTLSQDENQLLAKGLSFCPTPRNINCSHSPVTTSTNHVNDQSINHITTTVNHPTPTRNPTVSSHPVINAPDHSTPIRSRIRRRKRKTKTNRYWRRDNHNIQLDTNAVINLSSVTLSQDENQLLARGLSFCPTPRNINWTEVRADLHEFSRRMRLLEYFHDYP